MKRLVLAVGAIALAGAVAGGCFVAITDDGLAIGAVVRPPVLSPIAGTSISVVTSASGDVFFYGGSYYRYWNGGWWHSPYWNRGWLRTTIVPGAFLTIPASHPRYRVVRYHPHYRRVHVTPPRVVVPRPRKTPRVITVTPPRPPKAPRVITVTPGRPPKGPKTIPITPAPPPKKPKKPKGPPWSPKKP